MYTPKQRQVATDLAHALNDRLAIGLYLTYAATIPHEVLDAVLGKVLSIPYEKIKKNRAALFTHLIEQYKEHGNLGR